MKRFCALVVAIAMVLCIMPFTIAAADSTATVIGGWLRLRSAPSLSSTILSSYYTGTVVTIIDGPTNNWYHVRTPDNLVGYMLGDYLSTGGTPSTTAYVVNASGNNVNLRTGPGTSYSVIRDFAVGTPVTVLSYGAVWSRVSIYGYTGYMMSCYIGGSSPTPTPTPVCYATIWSANGYGVRLRSGPGKSYSSKGSYAVGTTVSVLQKGAVWDYISVGSRTGWMMNEFLIYNGEKQVTSVSLNSYSPYVGDELYALSITPSGATVTYQWYVGGVLSGTNSTYTVKSSDQGKCIYLVVTGTGNYTGSAKSTYTQPVAGQYYLQYVELNNNSPVVGDVLTTSYSPASATVSYEWYSGYTLITSASTYTVSESDVGKQIYVKLTGVSPYQGTVYSMKTAVVASSKTLLSVSLDNTTSTTRSISAPAVGDTLCALFAPTSATVSCQWCRDGYAIAGETSLYYTLTEADLGHYVTAVVSGTGSYLGTLSATTGKVVAKPVLPVITTDNVPSGVVNIPYYTQLQSNASDVIWNISDGYEMPAGLYFANGYISGTPTQVGSTTVQFTVTNSNGSSSKNLVFTINQELITLNNVDWASINDTSVDYASTESGIIAQLPSSVGIETSAGSTAATLQWTLEGFDPSKIDGYQITAKAKLIVPDGVTNPYLVPVEKSITVNVSAMPVEPMALNITSSVSNPIPAGTPVTLTASVSGGVPPYSYQWEVSSEDQPSIVYTMPGSNATVSLTVRDSASHEITSKIGLVCMIPMSASITANPATAVTPGTAVEISVVATDGSGSYTYLWGNGDTTPSRTVTPTGTTMYSVSVSDGYTTKDLSYTVEVTAE